MLWWGEQNLWNIPVSLHSWNLMQQLSQGCGDFCNCVSLLLRFKTLFYAHRLVIGRSASNALLGAFQKMINMMSFGPLRKSLCSWKTFIKKNTNFQSCSQRTWHTCLCSEGNRVKTVCSRSSYKTQVEYLCWFYMNDFHTSTTLVLTSLTEPDLNNKR